MTTNTNNPENKSEKINISRTYKLYLHNDNINTFQYVIETLVKVCNYDEIQSEQLALIAHYNGKSIIKTGDADSLTSICQSLINEGLSATIEF